MLYREGNDGNPILDLYSFLIMYTIKWHLNSRVFYFIKDLNLVNVYK